jgi:hypothetical protein
MRDVRIVARVLDDAGAGEIGMKLMGREREFGDYGLRGLRDYGDYGD